MKEKLMSELDPERRYLEEIVDAEKKDTPSRATVNYSGWGIPTMEQVAQCSATVCILQGKPFRRTINGIKQQFILAKTICHCSLVGLAPACDKTGCEFDSWQCRIYIPYTLSLGLLGYIWLWVHMAWHKNCVEKKDNRLIPVSSLFPRPAV